MSEEDAGRWGLLAIAGTCGFCCITLTTVAGGAAVTGGAVAGVTATSGAIRSLGGLLVTAVATALPLLVIGLFLRHRARTS